MKRTLSLKREALSELTPAELRSVAGGAPPTFPVRECLLDTMSCIATCQASCHCYQEA